MTRSTMGLAMALAFAGRNASPVFLELVRSAAAFCMLKALPTSWPGRGQAGLDVLDYYDAARRLDPSLPPR